MTSRPQLPACFVVAVCASCTLVACVPETRDASAVTAPALPPEVCRSAPATDLALITLPDDVRVSFDEGLHSGVTQAVRYARSGCHVELELLTKCHGPGVAYDHTATGQTRSDTFADAEQLWPVYPLGIEQIAPRISSPHSLLRIDRTVEGWFALSGGATGAASVLSGEDCARATHLISGYSEGTFSAAFVEKSAEVLSHGDIHPATKDDAAVVVAPLHDGGGAKYCHLIEISLTPLRRETGTASTRPSLEGAAMVRIPGGRAQARHQQWSAASFELDRSPVTTAAYAACVDAGACTPVTTGFGAACNSGRKSQANHPINCVTFQQARTYCHAVGKRLPSQAELNYAEYASFSSRVPIDVQERHLVEKECFGRHGTGTCDVNDFPPGPFGLLALSGNVQQWTADGADSGVRTLEGGAGTYGAGWGYNAGEAAGVQTGFRCAR